MTPENVKRLVTRTMRILLTGNPTEAADLLSDDLEWIFPDMEAGGRTLLKGKKAAIERCQSLKAVFPDGLDLNIERLTHEDNRVAVEYDYRARTAAGDSYHNFHCTIFELKGDKIAAMREHVDTFYAARRLGPLMKRD